MPDTHEAIPARPPYDGATAALLERIEALGVFRTMTVENIPTWRAPVDEVRAEFLVRCPDVDLEDVDVVREDGTTLPAAAVRLSRGLSGDRPGPLFLSLHGGGLIMGCRFNGLLTVVPWLRRYGGVIISPEYRLAPENPAPAGVEDCYGTLCWAIEHAAGLGIDPERVVVVGPSAGGGLSAGTLLMARDRQGPAVLGGLLDYPMLDDRSGLPGWQGSVSARQYPDDGTWPTAYNDVAWEAALGRRRGTELVTPYEAPARATWLDGLPPLFISVASAEVFRDEAVAFASKVWRDGGDAELHVYPGGTHAMEFVNARWLAQGLTAARDLWMDRLLHPEDPRLNIAAVAQAGTYPALTEEVMPGWFR